MMAAATLAFLILSPFITLVLLYLKGLPSFTVGHNLELVLWVYQVTWVPALMSGLVLALALAAIRPWIAYFTRPYDFGRCFSLGAIAGALAEALCTWVYRAMSHRPFSSFWIAGAMISGALTGAGITAALLRRKT
jgi:hypothetical protein